MDTYGFIPAVAFSPQREILAGNFDGHIRFWRVADGQLLLACEGHAGMSGRWPLAPMAVGSLVGVLTTQYACGIPTAGDSSTLQGHTDAVRSVASAPMATAWSVAVTTRRCACGNVQTGQLLKTLKGHTNTVNAVAFSPNGRVLANGQRRSDGARVECPDRARHVRGHTNRVWSVAFSPDGQRLASSSDDQQSACGMSAVATQGLHGRHPRNPLPCL